MSAIGVSGNRSGRSGHKSDLLTADVSPTRGVPETARRLSGRRHRALLRSLTEMDGLIGPIGLIVTSAASVRHPRARLSHSNGR